MKPPLSYPGGKTFTVKEILKRMPPHTTFIEPFLGGGSLFFNKEKSKKEVLNDKDNEIMQFYEALRTPGVSVRKTDMTPSRERFNRYKKMKIDPSHPQQIVNRTLYLNRRGFGGKMTEDNSYAPSIEKRERTAAKRGGVELKQRGVSKIGEDQQKRLKGTKLMNKDFRVAMKECNGGTCFVYLDPPYNEIYDLYNYDENNQKDLNPNEVFKSMKEISKSKGGYAIASYNDTPAVRVAAKKHGLNIEVVELLYSMANKGRHKELLISNYDTRAMMDFNKTLSNVSKKMGKIDIKKTKIK